MNRPAQKAPAGNGVPAEAAEAAPGVLCAPQEYGQECGGKGGVPYCTFARPPERITRIRVWHRQYVDGLQLETNVGVLPRLGGMGKHNHDIRHEEFELDPDEFLTGVSVETWTYLDRITFHSNKRSYGPFGGPGGQVKVRLEAPPGRQVTGFKGRHWDFIDSLQLMIV